MIQNLPQFSRSEYLRSPPHRFPQDLRQLILLPQSREFSLAEAKILLTKILRNTTDSSDALLLWYKHLSEDQQPHSETRRMIYFALLSSLAISLPSVNVPSNPIGVRGNLLLLRVQRNIAPKLRELMKFENSQWHPQVRFWSAGQMRAVYPLIEGNTDTRVQFFCGLSRVGPDVEAWMKGWENLRLAAILSKGREEEIVHFFRIYLQIINRPRYAEAFLRLYNAYQELSPEKQEQFAISLIAAWNENQQIRVSVPFDPINLDFVLTGLAGHDRLVDVYTGLYGH